MALTRQRISEQLHPELGFIKQPTSETVDSLPERIKASLASGGDMMLRQQCVVTFKCSRQLRATINTH